VQPIDLSILVGDQGRPVEMRLARCPAIAARLMKHMAEFRGVNEQLFRNAAANNAGAADAIFLSDGDARAVSRSKPRGPDAARTRADGEKIVVVFGHAHSSFRAS